MNCKEKKNKKELLLLSQEKLQLLIQGQISGDTHMESSVSTCGMTEKTSRMGPTCTWAPSSEIVTASETWLIGIFIKEWFVRYPAVRGRLSCNK